MKQLVFKNRLQNVAWAMGLMASSPNNCVGLSNPTVGFADRGKSLQFAFALVGITDIGLVNLRQLLLQVYNQINYLIAVFQPAMELLELVRLVP